MIPFVLNETADPISAETMSNVYEQFKTPRKIGPVMRWEDRYTDSPTVFAYNGIFYMYFIAIAKDIHSPGYETHLARSRDLICWEYIGPIFRRDDRNHWDSKQCAGYAAFFDTALDGTGELQKIGGCYHISYLAGNSDGYEPDPLYMGLARTTDPTDPCAFTRLPDPILKPDDPDVRPFEEKTLYKSFMFFDRRGVTGHPFVNVYNAKGKDNRERIFLAVSDDGEHWERYGGRAVLDLVSNDPEGVITGDPQIVQMDDLYVMLFFRYRLGEQPYNTFACSRNLIDWTVWDGEPLVKSEYPWESNGAHKTWFIRHNDRNYHFYCAADVGSQERFIALAVSDSGEAPTGKADESIPLNSVIPR